MALAIDVSFAMMSGCVFDVSADLYSVRLSASHQMTARKMDHVSYLSQIALQLNCVESKSYCSCNRCSMFNTFIRYYQVFLCAFVPVRATAPGRLEGSGFKE